MDVDVGVIDRTPCFRAGLVCALERAGFAAYEVEHPRNWLRLRRRAALLVTAEDPAELEDVALLRKVRADVAVVVLLGTASTAAYGFALRIAGCPAVGREAAPEEIIDVLQGALRNRTVLPFEVARELAVGVAGDAGGVRHCLGEQELGWLRQLAGDVTVRRLAASAGYSERQMFRLLQQLYRRLGVSNRQQALMQAARLDLLAPDYAA